MKTHRVSFFLCLGLLCAPGAATAASLREAGVLGNSGEQGATLVRFGPSAVSGMGVVYDRYGSLWERAWSGVLNRYAVDGRLLASYPTAPGGGAPDRDTIALFDDRVMLKIGEKLYTLPLTAPGGTKPVALPVAVTRLSLGTAGGWAAAANDAEVFMVNATGEKRAVTTLPSPVEDIDLGPDGGVYVRTRDSMIRVDAAAPADQRGPWPAPGDRPQWLAGHWFGHAYHGTIRRFSAEFTTDPGVVLGGGSGSFIGYVEGNHELSNGRGMAHVGGNLFAVSGFECGIHLLEWHEADQRFTIIRRIGAVPSCKALAIDAKGRVWFNGGVWDWSDGPDAPVHNSVPGADAPGVLGASVLASGVLVAPAVRWGAPVIYGGKLDGPATLSANVDELTKTMVASTVVTTDKRLVLVVVDRTGAGVSYFIDTNGRASGKGTPVTLGAATPLKAVTSLASLDKATLLAAADGQVVEFAAGADGAWKETRRWQAWGPGAGEHFGTQIYLAASEGRIWIADADRQRVLCFDAGTRRPLAAFGKLDVTGDSLAEWNRPQAIAANGGRAVVFDAGNQRLVRLELTAP